MAYFKDSDFQSFNNFTEDLAKYKASADNALKKIESIYNDVMGVQSTFEDALPTSEATTVEEESSNLSFFSDISTVKNNAQTKFIPYNQKDCCDYSNKMYTLNSNLCCPYHVSQRPTFCSHFCTCFNRIDRPTTTQIPSHYSCSKPKILSSVSVQCNEPDIPKEPFKSKYIDIPKHISNITIPKPFNMTIRAESEKHIKELKRQQLINEINEPIEKELQVRIRSKPVPAHVHLPLYKSLSEFEAARKHERKMMLSEKTQETVKPFNTSLQQKKQDFQPCENNEEKYVFRANPIPRHILRHEYSQKLKYKKDTRERFRHQRAKETLAQALPPSCYYKPLNRSSSTNDLKQNPKNVGSLNRSKSFVKVNAIPREQSKNMMMEWNEKVKRAATCSRHLASDSPPNINTKDYEKRYKDFLKQEASPFHKSVRKTVTCILREEEKRRQAEKEKVLVSDFEKQRFRKEIAEKLQSTIQLNNSEIDYQKEIQQRVEEYRKAREERQIEYEQELREIQERIKKRPLLIERLSQGKKTNSSQIKKADDSEKKNQFDNQDDLSDSKTNQSDIKSNHSENKENSSENEDNPPAIHSDDASIVASSLVSDESKDGSDEVISAHSSNESNHSTDSNPA